MKSIFKSIFVIGAAALFAVSCNVENIGTLYTHEGEDNGVSFTHSILANTEISASAKTYSIILGRAVATAAQTVNIASTVGDPIKVPSSVTFEAGQASAELVLDISNIDVGTTYTGKLSLANESDYNDLAIKEVSVTLAKAYTWGAYKTVKITDDLVTSCFGVQNVTWEVEAEKAEGFEVYRLLDPYGPNYPYNDPGDYKLGAKWVINANDPNAVTFDRTYLGFDWGYGEFNVYMDAGVVGKMVSKVITFPANGLKFNLPAYGTFTANNDGKLAIDLN